MDKRKLLIVTPTLGESKFTEPLKRALDQWKESIIHVLSVPRGKETSIQKIWPNSYVTIDDKTGRGMYAAINAALKFSQSYAWEYFIYINDDDLIEIDSIFSAIDKYPEADFIYGDYQYIDRNGDTLYLASICPNPTLCLPVWRIGYSPISQQAIVLRRNLVEETGSFCDSYRYAGDMDYYIRALKNAQSIVYHPTVLGAFRIHSDQLSSDQLLFQAEIEKCRNHHFTTPKTIEKLLLKTYFRGTNARRILNRAIKFGFRNTQSLFLSN